MSQWTNIAVILTAVDNMTSTVAGAVKKSSSALEKFENSKGFKAMDKLGDNALIAGGIITGGFGLAIKAAADLETKQIALNTAFQGNKVAAKAAFDSLQGFAAKTPYQMEEVITGFLKLKNMGLDPSERALTAYGNTASAMGKSLNDMVEAVADAATGEFERLKEFGIKASSQGDKVKFTFRGVSTTVAKNAADIEKYLMKVGETEFAGGIEEQSKSFNGQLSTMKDNATMAFQKIGQIVMPTIARFMKDIGPLIDRIGKWIDKNPDLVKGIGTVGVALLAFGGTIKLITGAVKLFNIVSALNPWVLVAAAVVGAAVLVYKYWGPISSFFKKIWDGIKKAFSAVWDAIVYAFKTFTPIGLLMTHWKSIMGFGRKMYEAGKNLVSQLWEGMKALASKPVEAITNIAKKIRSFLPFSPAKEGPLRDIHKVRIIETIAETMKPAPMVKAMRTAAAAVSVAMPIAGSGAPSTFAPPILPSATAQIAARVSAGGGLTVHAPITLTIQGGATPQSVEDIKAQLQKHADHIADMVNRVNDRNNRKRF